MVPERRPELPLGPETLSGESLMLWIVSRRPLTLIEPVPLLEAKPSIFWKRCSRLKKLPLKTKVKDIAAKVDDAAPAVAVEAAAAELALDPASVAIEEN